MRQTNKLFLLLALLLTAATGAWAQTETLLTTITATGKDSYSETTTGVVTVTHDNDDFEGSWGWLWWFKEGSVTVEAKEGYTISKCVFRQESKSPVTVSTAPFKINFIYDEEEEKFSCEGMDGVSSIEVYGYAPAATTYTVSLKDGVKDADKWTITPNEGLKEGDQVTLTYNGRLKVKGVKATSDAAPAAGNTVDLSTLTADYEAQDGDVLTGTLAANVMITIAAGATVTLSGAVINGTSNNSYKWAGLTLAGDGTIILSGENTVRGFFEDYPGISVPAGKTLTIQGTGSLDASSNGYGAGIGGGWSMACGNITIEGGTVTATGGSRSAGIGGSRAASCGNISITGGTVTATGGQMAPGIGGGYGASCGNISITGGTVTATGGDYAAGIGGGYGTSCGDITIANTVTKVTATKGDNATNSIGVGMGGTCGTVTIGGNVGAITESPYTYQPSN